MAASYGYGTYKLFSLGRKRSVSARIRIVLQAYRTSTGLYCILQGFGLRFQACPPGLSSRLVIQACHPGLSSRLIFTFCQGVLQAIGSRNRLPVYRLQATSYSTVVNLVSWGISLSCLIALTNNLVCAFQLFGIRQDCSYGGEGVAVLYCNCYCKRWNPVVGVL
jgi:hypothetical protein